MSPFPFLLLLVAVTVQSGAQLDRIWRGGKAPHRAESCELNAAIWNIERGENVAGVAQFLKPLDASVILLQEVDMHARRTGGRNIAEQLALPSGLQYYFAPEFEELGQKIRGAPAYHGQALLTSLPAADARIIRFEEQSDHWQPRWYLPNWAVFQRRTGGRIALVAELGTGPRRLVAYNVHLESRGSEERRLRQINEVIADARRYSADTPILLAGDLNTRQAEPPAVGALLKAGFRKALGGEVTTRRGAALDWVFVRGPVSFHDGAVHGRERAADHFPLTLRLRFETPDCRR